MKPETVYKITACLCLTEIFVFSVGLALDENRLISLSIVGIPLVSLAFAGYITKRIEGSKRCLGVYILAIVSTTLLCVLIGLVILRFTRV